MAALRFQERTVRNRRLVFLSVHLYHRIDCFLLALLDIRDHHIIENYQKDRAVITGMNIKEEHMLELKDDIVII